MFHTRAGCGRLSARRPPAGRGSLGERLTVRDALRADPRLLGEYQALKRGLAADSEHLAE